MAIGIVRVFKVRCLRCESEMSWLTSDMDSDVVVNNVRYPIGGMSYFMISDTHIVH